jgi:two-component system, chemotaxis family, CheB/CheR fusion protein
MPTRTAPGSFLVVGLGASAGGLEAMTALFDGVDDEPGVAFVVVSHQHPGFASALPALLGRHTSLPVVEAQDGMALVVNQVFVAPPSGRLAIEGEVVRLFEREAGSPLGLPIDFFFQSLAVHLKERAVAIVLSGTGSDGAQGVRAVKGVGGLVIAQEPATAGHDGMPRSAIDAGVVDWVLPPGEIGQRLVAFARGVGDDPGRPHAALSADALGEIFARLRARTGHDFSSYKASTMRRRTERRMELRGDLEPAAYLARLASDPAELDALFHDLLIGVTTFFRDPDVWQALADGPLAARMAERQADLPLRVWVPGCSTGEEAFTLAIVATEVAERLSLDTPITIFATDLDPRAIVAARTAVYGAGIAAGVTPERLDRFFVAEDGGYRVRKELRERVIFAQHDVLSDPPFTRLDVLSCRNLLIYMDAALQERLLPTFHYALDPGGLLVLGASESLGARSETFDAIDGRLRIFRRRDGVSPPRSLGVGGPTRGRPVGPPAARPRLAAGLAARTERFLCSRHLPPAIVVNERGDLLHLHGRTGLFLEPAPGLPSHNAFAMAREGLSLSLAATVREALSSTGPVSHRGVEVRSNGHFTRTTVTAETMPGDDGEPRLVVVTFAIEPEPAAPTVSGTGGPAADAARVQQLELEMARSRSQLQRSIEELQSSNEEQQSMNEELQSANEELETSKEEMHSLNEELRTVNAELLRKVQALSQVNDDMDNLLNSTEIATLFLDRELKVKRFTRPARSLIHLIDGDVGRPISDLGSVLTSDPLPAAAGKVLRTLEPHEAEVESRQGKTYLMRVLPYRTTANVIDGLVVSFIDTSELVAARELAASRALAGGMVDTVREPLLVLDERLRVVRANGAFQRIFGLTAGQVAGAALHEVGGGAWDDPELRRRLLHVVADDGAFEDLPLSGQFPGLGRRRLLLNARRLRQGAGLPALVLLAMEPASDAAPALPATAPR